MRPFPVPGRSVLIGVLALCVAGSASAFNPQPDPPGFGMIGIIESQTARLHVVFLPAVQVGARGAGRVAAGPTPHMNVLLQFVNESGDVLAESRATLEGGEAAHLDYASPRGGALRTHLRGVVRFVDNPDYVDNPDFIGNPDVKGRVIGTVEVFDTVTGATAFVLPGTESCIKEVEPGK